LRRGPLERENQQEDPQIDQQTDQTPLYD